MEGVDMMFLRAKTDLTSLLCTFHWPKQSHGQSAGQFNFLHPQKNKNDVSLLHITDVRLTDPKGMD